MEKLVMNRAFWNDKCVFLTGHTGFKGGWLALWLADMGAKVHGYALAPHVDPSLFNVVKLQDSLASSTVADVRDATALAKAMHEVEPDIVMHLAAQPLVRHSFVEPLETYTTNVMGTVNLLEAVRQLPSIKAVINITTDKCYENREWVWPYREDDVVGGPDPYSSSKACSELVSAAYRESYLKSAGIQLASARAGNVIGGGDWAIDRLVPDFLRARDAKQPLVVRSPLATRPWQHVLEPLSGYLSLAEKLFTEGPRFAEAWNFGPEEADNWPVQRIVTYLCNELPDTEWRHDATPQTHEAHTLKLDISKAKSELSWCPRWSLSKALSMTLEWHQAWKRNENMTSFSLHQIQEYEGSIAKA